MCLDSIQKRMNKKESEGFGEVVGYKVVDEIYRNEFRPMFFANSIDGLYSVGKSYKNIVKVKCCTDNLEKNGRARNEKYVYMSGFHVYSNLKDAKVDLVSRCKSGASKLCVIRVKCKDVSVLGKQVVRQWINRDHAEPQYVDCFVCNEMKVVKKVADWRKMK